MSDKFTPLQHYLQGLHAGTEEVTLTFEIIEGIMNDTLPPIAYQDVTWWGNQKQGTQVEVIAWMDAGWLVETVDLHEKWVRFVRQ